MQIELNIWQPNEPKWSMHDIILYQAPLMWPHTHTHTHTHTHASIIKLYTYACIYGGVQYTLQLSHRTAHACLAIYTSKSTFLTQWPCSCFQPKSHHPWLSNGTLHLLPLMGKQDTNAKTIMHWNHRLSPLYWGEKICWCCEQWGLLHLQHWKWVDGHSGCQQLSHLWAPWQWWSWEGC